MAKYNVIFESKEILQGYEPRGREWVRYDCKLIVKDGGKLPVSFEMNFVPPHPYVVNMPLQHAIAAESITAAYGKVAKFLAKHGIRFTD